jgi:hypothetical protein
LDFQATDEASSPPNKTSTHTHTQPGFNMKVSRQMRELNRSTIIQPVLWPPFLLNLNPDPGFRPTKIEMIVLEISCFKCFKCSFEGRSLLLYPGRPSRRHTDKKMQFLFLKISLFFSCKILQFLVIRIGFAWKPMRIHNIGYVRKTSYKIHRSLSPLPV